MTYLIKKWFLPDEMKEEYHTEVLDDLSKVNIFIGPNNSGKSWFMRRLIALPKEMISPTEFDLDRLLYIIGDIRNQFETNLNLPPVQTFNKLFSNLYNDSLVPQKYIETNKKHPINIDTFIDSLKKYEQLKFESPLDYNNQAFVFNSIIEMREYLLQNIEELNTIKNYFREEYEFYKIYIPVLRGLRTSRGHLRFYDERTLKDYFNENNKINLFTGVETYDSVDSIGRGEENERPLKDKYQKLLSKYFFEDQKIELTSRKDKDVIYVKVGNEKEFPIYELGDGIQQLIIMTYPLFINKDKDVLAFIEEPELYLHPGLQRTLLELLSSNEFGNLQTFVTTHSNHFLDMTLDFDKISVYRFSKEIKENENNEIKTSFHIENTGNEDLNLLECLGVKNSSVMLTNCTIWVEGITDRMYIRNYLKLYQKYLKNNNPNAKIFEEDKHYSFVEYSGNNITHWSFLDKDEEQMDVEHLCGKLFLISDKDEKKEPRHEELEENLGDRYHCLESREIENLITPEVLFEVVKEYEEDDDNLKKPHSQNSYKKRYMGKYIEENVLIDKSKTKRPNKDNPYSSKSGTIKDKVAFAQKAIKHINQIEDMSDEAVELCKKIYKFIESNNN